MSRLFLLISLSCFHRSSNATTGNADRQANSNVQRSATTQPPAQASSDGVHMCLSLRDHLCSVMLRFAIGKSVFHYLKVVTQKERDESMKKDTCFVFSIAYFKLFCCCLIPAWISTSHWSSNFWVWTSFISLNPYYPPTQMDVEMFTI